MKRVSFIMLILFLAAFIIGLTLHFSSHPLSMEDMTLKSPQDALSPLGMPKEGAVDHRLYGLSVWQRMALPVVDRIDSPIGSESGAFSYNAQPFWAMNDARGGHHTGDDLNGIGGMNTDLGDPVYAAANGVVVYTGVPSPGWGNVLILSHRLADGRIFQTMYAHLLKINVSLDALVGRGQQIGSVGTANGVYPAHLHYEIRQGAGVDIGAGYAANPFNRVSPVTFSSSLQAPADALQASALNVHQLAMSQKDPRLLLDLKNPQKIIDILEK